MKCGHCNQDKESVWIRRTNTAYVEEKLNWVLECDECFEQTEAYWETMWEDNGH